MKLMYSFLFFDDTISYALHVKVVTTVREAVMFCFKELSRHSQGGPKENQLHSVKMHVSIICSTRESARHSRR
jgi:hypothetical protein